MTKARHIKFGTFLSVGGEHVAAWRHPDTAPHLHGSFAANLELARAAEEALLDLILVADVGPPILAPMESLSTDPVIERLDPLVTVSALAVSTRHIGLISTASTTFEQPYHVARRIASLDHVSGGRAGWNCVTSSNVAMALNFSNREHLAPAERYARAEEFVDVVRGLWNSWDDDAFVLDRDGPRYFEPAGLHVLNHAGKYFSVRGPLDVARCPQGQPVIVQAGSSEPGRALAARVADVVFTTHTTTEAACAFYADIKARAASYGRDPDSVLVLLALMPSIGPTEAEAKERLEALDRLIPAPIALARLSAKLGSIDLSGYDPNAPLPEDLPAGTGMLSRRQPFIDLAKREGLTMMELAARTAGNRGHWTVAGTGVQIADAIQQRFEVGAADGFLLVPPLSPSGLGDFGREVVPVLQERGLYRTGYDGAMLREMLGLPRPAMA
ncbi:LLM class flavin-dependent oxidoreductase [Ancylobacter sp. MQZ15Z-1]|uniref:LLM class flavin-dependent oxidoreductase n=1 Tax=Ancylobacter mangrovi TaxID=2972472 RepID=A0A9X2PCR1_9HYPH|nr:LLM class flavin-dependent oxidoreductase [Ancylobacter mangrovi]MCS0495535.1 LLM class flavin-dependent oxidoreductase [Ancylobacter mangrovi]